MPKQDIVVIGGSAGSATALKQILSGLPADVPASVFVATHIPSTSDYLRDMLSRTSAVPVVVAVDGQPIERARVYVAAADHHLLLIDGRVHLGNGPRENMARPAIDPLFRSAALSYGPRTVGVILSGMLNDGASGLSAIKACGGTAIVQHPLDATSDQMPLAALEAVDVDQIAAGEDLARVILEVIGRDAGRGGDCPRSLALEVEIAAGARLGSEALRQFADPSPLTCPECGGVLSEVLGQQPLRYRCQTGHAHTAEILDANAGEIDQALGIALRIIEERVSLVTRMAQDARERGRSSVAELFEARAIEFGRHASILREAALNTVMNDGAIRRAAH